MALEGQTLTLPLMEKVTLRVVDLLPDRDSARLMLQDDPSYALEERIEVGKVLQNRVDAVRDSLSPFAGQRLTRAMLETIAIAVTGWWEEAAIGIRKPLDWRTKDPTWGAMFIHDLHRIPCRGRMFRLKVRSYAGVTAGMWWSPVWSGGILQTLIRDAGCRRYDEYKDEDAAGLWFTARVSVNEGRLRFADMCSSSSQERLNKDLQARRREVCQGPFEPLKGKGVCRVCPMSMSQCPNARSMEPYNIVMKCRCGKQGYFREDAETRGWCLACMVSGRFNVKKTD
jgi:hypothetical protein